MAKDGRSQRQKGRAKAAPGTDAKLSRGLPRSARVALLVVALVLAAMADDRWVGGVADGRQMIRTAVAITETGGIGQARGTDFSLPREGGDAVSRFGMGFSLLQVPAAWLAPRLEAMRGPGSSQSLFLIVPWLAVLATAWAAARAALLLGAPERAAAPAVLLASLASPMASYAAMEFSEPVQAAALGFALVAALAAVRQEGRREIRLAAAAGLAAGFAVLTKSSLIVVAPWVLLPLLAAGDRRRLRSRSLAAALGAAVPLALWLAFELARFGRLFGGYPDDRFTNPFFDGLWRLLIGPNRGLLLFFPAAAAAALWAWRSLRSGERAQQLAAGAVWLPVLAMLAVAAPYWGWHGMEGWGPRLVLPAVALLAPAAAVALARWRPAASWVVVAVCLVVNLPPLLQHPTPVATYVMNCRWPEVPAGRDAADLPFYARGEAPSGEPTVVPFEVLEREPSASWLVVAPWYWRTTLAEPGAQAARLASPPWASARPDIVPDPALLASRRGLEALAPPPRLGFLGRSLLSGGAEVGFAVYDEALRDQVIRAQQQREVGLALELALKLARLAPSGEAGALVLESYRLAGRRTEAHAYLQSMPREHRREPRLNVVLALFERDAGSDSTARTFLESVASSFPGTPAAAAVGLSPGAWPADLQSMTTVPRRDATVAGASSGR